VYGEWFERGRPRQERQDRRWGNKRANERDLPKCTQLQAIDSEKREEGRKEGVVEMLGCTASGVSATNRGGNDKTSDGKKNEETNGLRNRRRWIGKPREICGGQASRSFSSSSKRATISPLSLSNYSQLQHPYVFYWLGYSPSKATPNRPLHRDQGAKMTQ